MTQRIALRLAAWAAAAASLILATSGCSFTVESPDSNSSAKPSSDSASNVNEITMLPKLTARQQAQEMVGQTELEINTRLTLLSDLASSCDECSNALMAALAASTQRLEEAGGTWDPWEGFEQRPWSQVQVQSVPPTPQPGFTVSSVAGYMAATAEDGIATLAEAGGVPSADRITVSALLLERLASASALANEFGFSVTEAATSTRLDETPSFVIDGAWDESDDLQNQQSVGDNYSLEEAALIQYDCISLALIRSISTTSDEALSSSSVHLSQQIQDRTTALGSLGVEDLRRPRCSLALTDPQALLADLVRVGVSLLGSEDPALRASAVPWTLEDTELLANMYPEVAKSLSLLSSLTDTETE